MGFIENGLVEVIVGIQQCILLEEGSTIGRGFLSKRDEFKLDIKL